MSGKICPALGQLIALGVFSRRDGAGHPTGGFSTLASRHGDGALALGRQSQVIPVARVVSIDPIVAFRVEN